MTTRRTRFQDEEEREKNVYENIDVLFLRMRRTGDEEETSMELICELLKALTGVTSNGSYDPDVATVGRHAAGRWLRAVGYVTE